MAAPGGLGEGSATGAAVAAGAILAGWCAPTVLKAASEPWGDLVGRFIYDGTPPERKKLKADKDVDRCGKFNIRDESLMVWTHRSGRKGVST